VITYEFFYAVQPFHADVPGKILNNILSGEIKWDRFVAPPKALDLMKSLLTLAPEERLGSGGVEEVKNHGFFAGIDWDRIST